ncbi:MAG: MBL fold metallo-hydrolase [Anaerolineaceae bacterium]|nr:MBL fold metallo-hydrolase [Anaerolineaceae bacterium]
MQYKILSLPITMPFGNTENTVYPTLLWDEQNIILVDCGFIGSLTIIEKELSQHGLSAERLTGLVLTHHDHDHMGAAAALKRVNPNLKIYASQAEAPYISAEEKPLRLCQAEEMQKNLPPEQQDFGKVFCDMLRRVEPILVDELLHDGDNMGWCGGCRIIATPGHTPGHISLLMEKDWIVITGDAMALEDGKPVIANPQFTLDIEQAESSMNKLLSLKANAYYCYHGGAHGKDIGSTKDYT